MAKVLRGRKARGKCKPQNFLRRASTEALGKILSPNYEQTKIRSRTRNKTRLTSGENACTALSVIYVFGHDVLFTWHGPRSNAEKCGCQKTRVREAEEHGTGSGRFWPQYVSAFPGSFRRNNGFGEISLENVLK